MFLFNMFSKSEPAENTREMENEKKAMAQGYPMTRTPFIHGNLKHAVKWKTFKSKGTPLLGLAYAHKGVDLVQKESLEMIRKKLLDWLQHHPELVAMLSKSFPANVVAVSYSHIEFEVGDSCHDFKLLPQFEQPENAFSSYRKLSESVQCTYLNVNGIEYGAGVCYYPTPHGKAPLLESNKALLDMIYPIPFPLQDRRESEDFKTYKCYSRFCKTAGKMVVVSMYTEDGIPRHYDFNHDTKTSFKTLCNECVEEYYKYKFEKKDSENLENHSEDFEKVDLDESKAKYDTELDAELVQ